MCHLPDPPAQLQGRSCLLGDLPCIRIPGRTGGTVERLYIGNQLREVNSIQDVCAQKRTAVLQRAHGANQGFLEHK